MNDKVKTYDQAVRLIEEIGLLPLAPLIPDYPSLDSVTNSDSWHSGTEYDPWLWRTQFSADGIAGYGKFIKKKSILVSRELLPYVKSVLGSADSVEERYYNGNVSKEAFEIYKIVSEEAGIDTRTLRARAGLKEKEQKRIFENALLEMQGSMDIVISGIQEKINEKGEKSGWNSTAFETYDSWVIRNGIQTLKIERENAKQFLISHFQKKCSIEGMKKIEKIFA